jgi:hypothetical protein
MKTIAERLSWALDSNAPEGIRGDRKAFQRLMRQRMGRESAQGTSYPAVLGYFAGKVSPSIEWLNVAADFLGVRAAWLAYGEGAMTDAERAEREEQARRFEAAIARAEGGREWKDALAFVWNVRLALGVPFPETASGVRLPAPDSAGTHQLDPNEMRAVLTAWARAHNASIIPLWYAPLAEAARRLRIDAGAAGRALRGPLDALGIAAADLSDDALADYIVAMIPALLMLAAHRQED